MSAEVVSQIARVPFLALALGAPCAMGVLVAACAPRDPPAAAAAPSATVAEASTTAAEIATAIPVEAPSPNAQFEAQLRASDPRLATWMDQAADLRLQILVTEVRDGAPWQTFSFRADKEYFYPASAIKPFIAVASLRFANARAKGPIEPFSRIIRCEHNRPRCEPPPDDEDKDAEKAEAESQEASATAEPEKKHKRLTFGEEIQKLLSYSDNDSYDRLYDMVGHRELNEAMAAIGFPEVRFQHRMGGLPSMQKTSLAFRLIRPTGQAIAMKERTSDLVLPPLAIDGLGIGASHQTEHGIVDGPMDFSEKNRASLHDMQRLLISLVYPEKEGSAQLDITDTQRSALVAAMTRTLQPGAKVADHYPMGPGMLDVVPTANLRYVGKAGKAYGFLLENAFVENNETHRAVFVAATVLANPDGVMNDDVYAYEEIARPVLRAIGVAVAQQFLVGR